MAFPAYRLPPGVEVGMRGGPAWYNIIQEAVSGQEQRIRTWAKCRGTWTLGYPILDSEDQDGDYAAVLALAMAHHGSLIPFPFKNWGDYKLIDELIGTGDGSETEFQITKTYDPSQILLSTPGALTYVRPIYLPRSGLVVKVDGVTKTITTDYTISSTGLITFTSSVPDEDEITVTGEFDTPVRLDLQPGEPLPIVINEANIAQIEPFGIREVIGTAELA